jgi:hypothetical protein
LEAHKREQQERARREEEEKRRREEELETRVAELEASGAPLEAVSRVLASAVAEEEPPSPPPPPTPVYVAPTAQSVVKTNTGAAPKTLYSGEVDNLQELIEAAATLPEAYARFLQVNEPALNAEARNQKDKFSIPGCRLKKQTGISTRRL